MDTLNMQKSLKSKLWKYTSQQVYNQKFKGLTKGKLA